MQTMYATIHGKVCSTTLPDPDEAITSDIAWGRFDELLTPAFWSGQVWQHQCLGTYRSLNLGRSLVEEVAACLLGGFGMKAELGLAAFARLRDCELLSGMPSADVLETALSKPFLVNGKLQRYRFPRQKAQYLGACLEKLYHFVEPTSDVSLREQLSTLPGIGPKTASWVVRNYRASNSVAIIDIHILRAGRHMRLFDLVAEPQRCYRQLEQRFLWFADVISAPAALLDSLMWDYMRRLAFSLRDHTKAKT